MITHYTRIAPLHPLTEDFKRRQERRTPKADEISPARLIAIEDELKSTINLELENRMNAIINETKSNETKVINIMDKCFRHTLTYKLRSISSFRRTVIRPSTNHLHQHTN